MDRLNNVRKRKRSSFRQAPDLEDSKEQRSTEFAPGLAAHRQPEHDG
jgi:hypothetical protein